MPDTHLTHMFDALSGMALGLWAALFIVILAGVVWVLRTERRQFVRRGKTRGWLWMRVLALPILALVAAAVVLPARAVSGAEALGVFYIALFTLAPVLWFGLHILAGWMQSPRFTRSESVGLAISGLAILIVPPLLVSMAQGPIFMLDHKARLAHMDNTPHAPLPHDVTPVLHFQLGDAGAIFVQSLKAPAGVQVERIRAEIGGYWHDLATMMHPYLCRAGEDIHLAWTAGTPLPPLQIHWRDAQGQRHQAEHRVTAPAPGLPAQPFHIVWREDGFDLPVAVSRQVVQLGWHTADGRPYTRTLDMLQPGETFQNDCVTTGYRRVAWQQEGPVAQVILRFHPTPPTPAWQAGFTRPALPPATDL